MIPRNARFPLRKEFHSFFSISRKLYSSHLTLYFLPRPTKRVAVVVPKKVNKSAVVRNRFKRILKLNLFLFPLSGDLVLFVKKKHLLKSSDTETLLLTELTTLLKKLKTT